MKQGELYLLRQDYLLHNYKYQMLHHTEFNYEILNNIMYITRAGQSKGKRKTYNNCFIMADTETSRKKLKNSKQISVLPSGHKARENHVVAWTISIRAFDMNIVTLYGHKPSTFCSTLHKIHDQMMGDVTIVYFHNYSYDYSFLRRFLFKEFGYPNKSLNIKAHYPLFMKFDCGIEIRDSLILAQKSLEKWAADMGVEHQKAVGKWNYTKFRSQNYKFSKNELQYIENDTLAGVECLNKLMHMLNKKVYSMPYTSTGIIREEIVKIGLENGARELFLSCVPTYEQYVKLTKLFHGGFTHANRFYIDEFLKMLVQCFDFTSSYPFVMLTEKYPMEKFHSMGDCKLKDILQDSKDTAYMFKLIMYKVELKEHDHVMPALQYSKCVECVNPVIDNGRILSADYVEIYLNEIDASVIADQYKAESHICTEVEYAHKDYLPRWFTDYIFELFRKKCELSFDEKDEIDYRLQKGKVNGCYGMTVQKSIADLIVEDFNTFEYKIDRPEDDAEYNKQLHKEYEKYIKKKRHILLYPWGVWVTSYAFRNVHELNKCVKPEEEGGLLLYNDTDSAYASGWDLDKIAAYNANCLNKLRANNYGSITLRGKTFTLGIAEHKPLKDDYTEFKILGAKRYAGRCKADNKIHITVAGVPKKGAECLNDDLYNFTKDFIFPGSKTGKKTHVYFVSDIYIDAEGNETADSVDLLPCDYKLDPTEHFDIDDMFIDEQEVQVYEWDD